MHRDMHHCQQLREKKTAQRQEEEEASYVLVQFSNIMSDLINSPWRRPEKKKLS